MSSPYRPSLTLVIPARDEASTIGDLLTSLKPRLLPGDELLVVDDGSTDQTAAIAHEAGATVLRLGRNYGKGVALRAGFEAASGDWVGTMDADGQDDARDLPTLLQAMADGADLAIGSRFLGHFDAGAISTVNRMATHAFNGLINALYHAHITDSQAGFRIFRRTLLERLHVGAREYEVETEMLLQALRLGADVREVPVTRHPRTSGVTSFSRIRHGIRILATVLAGRSAR